jgi:twitching motility protein PilI
MTSHALSDSSAFNLLLSLEGAVLLNGGAVPKSADARAQWSGVRCVVAGMNVIVPLQQVKEILEPRSLTAIPGCASWIKGLMNVRGRLLPVFGVSEFFGGARIRMGAFQIIVVEQGTIFCGIAIDKVFGIQKFFQDDFHRGKPASGASLEELDEYAGLFTVVDDERWHQLDICRLADRMSHANPAVTVTHEGRAEASRPQWTGTAANADLQRSMQVNE